MASSYGKALSGRLFVQAALTAVFAPLGGGGSSMLLALALGAAAGILGVLLMRGDVPNPRSVVIGFEVVAVLIGVVAVLGHHYIPGTIVGVVTLITVANNPAPAATAHPLAMVAAQAQPQPMFGVPTQQTFAAHAHAQQATAAPASSAFPASAAAVPAGQWAADPSGRHQYRWWDGTRWTEHVSSNGVAGIDPPV